MDNSLIDNLVADLKPVKPLNDNALIFLVIACFGALLAFVGLSIGMRKDLGDIIKNGVIYWKNGGLFIGAIVALYLTIQSARPQYQDMKFAIVPFLILLGLVCSQFVPLIENQSLVNEMNNINFGGWQTCLSVSMIGGAAIFAIIWNFWIKKSAPNKPLLFGFSSGALSALLAALAYSFHCNMDGIFYYLICYWLPILIFGAIGTIFGNQLKW
jgi:hypothetical protein